MEILIGLAVVAGVAWFMMNRNKKQPGGGGKGSSKAGTDTKLR